MHRLISFLSSIFRSLLCCLFLLSSVALAQTQPPSSTPPAAESKLKYINKIGHWVSAYMMSGPEFMYTERNRFKSSAFTEVYIEPLFDTDVWMFAMLNKVTLARYPDLEKQTPHVIVQVKFKPTSELFNSYSVKLVVQFSDQIKLDADKVADEANALFQPTYIDPAAARVDVQRAIAAALNSIAAKLGKSLAPDLLVRYNGDVFWNGHTLHILPFEGNYLELEAIGNDLQPLPADEISWTNADAFQSKAVVNLTGTSSKSVTLSQGKESMMITLRRMNLNVDFHELLKKFIVEALSTQKRAATDTLVYLRRDSVANEARIRDYIAYLERGNFPMEAGGAQVAMFSASLVRPDSLTMQDSTRHADIARSLLALKRQKKLKAVMRRKLNVAALADLLVDQPERMKELIDDLLRQSGSLVARLVLNTSSDSRANEARNLVVDYLNKNIEQITGKYYPPSATTDPPLTVPRAGNPPVFDAKKYLYVSAQANFAGKDELVAYLNDYLPKLDTPMYVFINYSHDTSVESYLARSPGARPVGLPAGARYKVFTVLHMPGSLLENVIGEGSTSATTVKESIEEGVREDEEVNENNAAFVSFKQKLIEEVGDEYAGFSCFADAYTRYEEVNERYNSESIAFFAAAVKFWLCVTEKENCPVAAHFECGVTNALLQELDWITLVDAVQQFEITDDDIKRILTCLANEIPIGHHPSNPTFEDAVFKCIIGVSITEMEEGIREFVRSSWTDPYDQGQALVFTATLVSPLKAGIIKKLKTLPSHAAKIIKFEKLATSKTIRELDEVARGLAKGGDDFADYVKTLKTKINPRKDYPDGVFERHVTGDDIQYEAIGGGEKIWADGIDSGKKALLDAKHNPGTFYTIESYNQKPFLYGDLEDEFRRYSKIISDKSNPVDELVIFISQDNPSSVKLFEHLGSKYNFPLKIELVQWNP